MEKRQTARKRTGRTGRNSVTVVGFLGEEVFALEASLRGDRVDIERWGTATAGGSSGRPGTNAEDSRGQAVVRALADAGIREKSVVLCLPARSVVVRRVQLPPAAPDQIPQLVRFEAQRHLPLPLDQLATGHLPFEAASLDDGGTEVLLAITRRDDLQRLSAALEAAGLQVEGCGVDALALADDMVNAMRGIGGAENGHASLVIISDPEGMHAQILHESRLLSTRYLPLGEGNWGADLARSLTAYALHHPQHPIDQVFVAGHVDEQLLTRTTGLPVRYLPEILEAGAGARLPVPYQALAAMARQWLTPSRFGVVLEPDDWQAVARQSGRSAALLAVAATVAAIGLLVVTQLDRQERARNEAAAASRLLRMIRSDRKQLARLKEQRDLLSERYRLIGTGLAGKGAGESHSPSPLELLRRIGNRAPGGVWLTQVVYRRGQPMQILGTTRRSAEVTTFIRSLETMPGCERVELGYLRSATVEDADVTQFRLDCVLEEQARETTMAMESSGRTPR